MGGRERCSLRTAGFLAVIGSRDTLRKAGDSSLVGGEEGVRKDTVGIDIPIGMSKLELGSGYPPGILLLVLPTSFNAPWFH
jgi:hypothetical protein